jgi:hypothetical protein
VDTDKIQALQDGEMPMLKSGLKARRACNQSGGHIRFNTDASEAIDLGDIFFNVEGRNLYKPGAQHEWGIAGQRLDRRKDLVLSYRPVLDENTAAMTPVSTASLHA